MIMIHSIYRWIFFLFAVLLISACGFHLRGESTFPFKTIYVAGAGSTSLGIALRNNLKSQKSITVVSDPQEADVILDIVSERAEKNILSLTVQGLVREYSLNNFVTFQVRSNDGKLFLPPTTVALNRVISYNENVMLSKASEEAMLYKDMQTDTVRQIVRRLSAMKVVDSVIPAKAGIQD